MKKRIVSLLLALCLCAGFLSLTAQADGSGIAEGSAEYEELEGFLYDFWCGDNIYDSRNVTAESYIMKTLFSMLPAYRGPVPGADRYGVEMKWTGYDPLRKFGGNGYSKADGAQVEWVLANVFNCSEADISTLRSSLGNDPYYKPYYYNGDYYAPSGAVGDSFSYVTITDITPYGNYYFVTFERRDIPEFTGSNDLWGRYFTVVQRKTMDNGTGYWSLYYYRTLKDGEILDLPTAPPDNPGAGIKFTDIPEEGEAWYRDYVYNAVRVGLINGVGNNKFEPESTIRRSEFLKVMVLTVYGEPENVPGSANWFDKYYAFAEENGLLDGIPANVEKEGGIPRYEMAQMLYNAAVYKGLDVESDSKDFYDSNHSYSASYDKAIKYAYGVELINGKDGSGDFAGANTLERAQAAKVIWLFYEMAEQAA